MHQGHQFRGKGTLTLQWPLSFCKGWTQGKVDLGIQGLRIILIIDNLSFTLLGMLER